MEKSTEEQLTIDLEKLLEEECRRLLFGGEIPPWNSTWPPKPQKLGFNIDLSKIA